MIQRVHERAQLARLPNRLIVATEDARIASVVREFGGDVCMTGQYHETGTDRVAEAARDIEADIVVNVQGDEPLLDPSAIDEAVEALVAAPEIPMATLSVALNAPAEFLSPSVVKVVVDATGDALYFSRSPIPHVRMGIAMDWAASAAEACRLGLARKHIGLYAYRRDALLALAAKPRAPLEEAEGLEQLRALHHGFRIRVVRSSASSGPSVDTPEDLERVRHLFRGGFGS